MIFVTIGTQEPFDRLIQAMDEIVPLLGGIPVIAQVFHTKYKAINMQTFDFITAKEFEKYFTESQLIVAHAGMGTVISALVKEKPLIVLPRLTKYHEHRSDHQKYSAEALEKMNYIHVAKDEKDLQEKVVQIIKGEKVLSLHKTGPFASPELLLSIRKNIGLSI